MEEMQKGIWVTKDGKVMQIKEMRDTHLLNTIAFIERKYDAMPKDCSFPCFNGEEAQAHAEREYEDFQETLFIIRNKLWELQGEAISRGLKKEEEYGFSRKAK